MKKIELVNVSKSIDHDDILKDVSLDFCSGNCYGLIGQNGSGKTMLLRLIAGLIKPTTGIVKFNNEIIEYGSKLPFSIGVIIENAGLYQELTCFDNLKLLAQIRKVTSKQRIEESIKRVGLDPKNKKKLRKYSLGMRQRAVMAQAIMEAPDVLLLDEPMNSLDKDGVDIFRNIILQEKDRGAIIIISSHIEEDINILCDIVYKVKNGIVTKRQEMKE